LNTITRLINILENPICISEVRRGLRSGKIFIIQTVYLFILALTLYLIWSSASNNLMRGQEIGRNILMAISMIQLILILLICPSFTCGAISNEKERQTYELLVTSLLKPHDIVLGKFFYSMAYSIIFLLASLPFTCTAFFFGGVSPREIIYVYTGLVCLAALISLMGLYYSARFRSTNVAMRSAYLTMFFLFIFGSNLIPIMFYGISPSLPSVSCFLFEMPLWIFIFLEFFFIVILLFFSTVNLIEEPVAKPSPLLRLLGALFFSFNVFAFSGIIAREMMLNSSSYNLSSTMSVFYIVIFIIAFIMVIGFACDPAVRKKYPFGGLFYTGGRFSAFYIPFLVFINLSFFSFIFLLYQPLLMVEAFPIKMFFSILLILLVLFVLAFTGKIGAKIFLKKGYSQVSLFIIILLINFLPLPSFISHTDMNMVQTITGFTYLQPVLSVFSIWNNDPFMRIGFMGEELALAVYSFIFYTMFLLILIVINAIIGKKDNVHTI